LDTIAQQAPYLGTADATSLIATALPAECTASLSPRLKVWAELYRAVAERNAERMADAGEAALQEGGGDVGHLYYALNAAMLGHVANRQPDRALRLWSERPGPLQVLDATPDVELVIRVAQKQLADGVLVSQRSAP
jgi:hypothetical protein